MTTYSICELTRSESTVCVCVCVCSVGLKIKCLFAMWQNKEYEVIDCGHSSEVEEPCWEWDTSHNPDWPVTVHRVLILIDISFLCFLGSFESVSCLLTNLPFCMCFRHQKTLLQVRWTYFLFSIIYIMFCWCRYDPTLSNCNINK